VDILEPLDLAGWETPVPPEIASRATEALERGSILFLPKLGFELTPAERRFLSTQWLSGKSKNISFNPATGKIGGSSADGADLADLTAMMRRFSEYSLELMRGLSPAYKDALVQGLTSFRPAEIAGRPSSWRKDDTRLHVDAFPSRPIQGKRILRFFANVNPSVPRVWRAGEPFEQAAAKLLPRVRPPLPGWLPLLPLLRITKDRRTLYDHYMLGLHDAMKADLHYQAEAPQTEIAFPAGSAWACFTDSVSHAAMSGQHAFEQTFYLPVEAMQDPALSPLRILEKRLRKALV
jgi:hypothetical protein